MCGCVYVHATKNFSVCIIIFTYYTSHRFSQQVVNEGCSEEVQCHAISLIYLATEHCIMAAIEFEQLGGMALIQQVLRTSQAAIGIKVLEVFMNWCCGVEHKRIKSLAVLESILLDWRIWHKASEGVWEKLLENLEHLLTVEDTANVQSFYDAQAIVKILLTSKVWNLMM